MRGKEESGENDGSQQREKESKGKCVTRKEKSKGNQIKK